MSFTRALYYPTIDIHNSDWAKSVTLFWDNIYTIVPQSIRVPYENIVTKIMFDEGILSPIFINSDTELVKGLANDLRKFIYTNEGFDFLFKEKGQSYIHSDKLPHDVRKITRIHPYKLPATILDMIRSDFRKDDWISVDIKFASFYMSLLANKICEHEHLVLLTDDDKASNLIEKARLDNQTTIFRSVESQYEKTILNLSEGLLSSLALKGISFSPDTNITDVIRFKRNHQDELGLFRINLTKLVKDIPKDVSFEQLHYLVNDIYINEFLPSYNNLKNALYGSKLKWMAENVMKVSFYSTGLTSIPTLMLGASIPQALIAGAGISLVASVVACNVDREERLRNNPYSYLYSAEQELSREKLSKGVSRRVF